MATYPPDYLSVQDPTAQPADNATHAVTDLYVPTVSVIIPAKNEAENLAHVLPRVPAWVHEIILVDGESTDETVSVAREVCPQVCVVHQDVPGKGAAIRTGIEAATGDIVVLLDADGSTDPQEIPVFVATLLAGADFAKGSRFLQGAGTVDMPFHRRLANEFLVLLTNALFGTRYSDITYGYNAIWRRHASALALEIDGWANEIVGNIRVARRGLKVVEVASYEYCRIAGEAKLAAFSAGWTILKAILAEPFHQLPDDHPHPPKPPEEQPLTLTEVEPQRRRLPVLARMEPVRGGEAD